MKRTDEQEYKINNIIKSEVYCLQNEVVELILKNEENWDDISNLYYTNEDGEEEAHEIFQWFAISGWLARQFREIGIPVLMSETYGNWWGRTTFGQAIDQDGEWDDLLEHLDKKVTNVYTN